MLSIYYCGILHHYLYYELNIVHTYISHYLISMIFILLCYINFCLENGIKVVYVIYKGHSSM